MLAKIFNSIFKNEDHVGQERWDITLASRVRTKSPIIFDVGANVGQSVHRFSRLFKSPVIHCFEPHSEAFKVLHDTYKNCDSIFTNHVGISDKKETLTLHKTLKSTNASFNVLSLDSTWIKRKSEKFGVSPEKYRGETEEVECITIDDYVQNNKINHIDLLKIDTQGWEDYVLSGAKQCLSNRKIDVLELELIFDNTYGRPLQFYDVEQYLIPNGYRLVGIKEPIGVLNSVLYCADLLYVKTDKFSRQSQ